MNWLKHSMAEFQMIWQFWLQLDIVPQQKYHQKTKNDDAQVWGNTRGDQKLETFIWPKVYYAFNAWLLSKM